MEPVVQTYNLKKTYRTGFWLNQKIESLKGCTLSINQGETFGLLGPNGAGKTTLQKILLGITPPTSGRGLLLGKPLGDQQSKQKIGYLPENAFYYNFLTGWELLEFTAGLFQIPRTLQQKRIPQLLELVGLSQQDAKKKQLKQYSKGMQQRAGMAQALINDPELVFLDEPMSGLDPIGRYQIREIILSLKAQKKTIFFNSHVLGDVEMICDRIAILAKGEIISIGLIEELLGKSNAYQITGTGGNPEQIKEWLGNMTCHDNCWQGELTQNTHQFIKFLDEIGASIITMNQSRISLEEFFIAKLQEKGLHQTK